MRIVEKSLTPLFLDEIKTAIQAVRDRGSDVAFVELTQQEVGRIMKEENVPSRRKTRIRPKDLERELGVPVVIERSLRDARNTSEVPPSNNPQP